MLENGQFETFIEQARRDGYGLRDDDYFVHQGFDPGPDLAAMAVPIPSKTGIHGTLSVLWLRDDFSKEEVLALGSLDDMGRAASRIGAAMDARGISAPVYDTDEEDQN